MTRILPAALYSTLLLPALLLAEPPQTGPETEKRFPPLKVPAGFKATLFACDPLIEYPSSIALGPRANTLFVAADYMTGLGTTDIIRRDEIRLVEDSDGDGYADKAPVWADGFNSIQGMTYHDGTVFVMHAPYLTALRDTDNDGVADERKNLFKGFGLGPEEDKVRLHNANGIVAGHDGWLYLALGDRGCDVVRPEGDLLILNGGGILRCRPDGRDLHVFSTGLRNIYDVALDEDLNVFTRDNENDGGNYKIRVIQSFFGADHGYPYLYDERPDEALAPLADLGLGSSAGGVYYKETQFPPEYRGLYFCEWGRAVMRYEPQSPGKPFSPMKEIEFASGAENDPYGFKPTDLVVDRDGSLLIADWCDGQRPKRGRARIYRVQSVGWTPSSDPKATSTDPQGRAGVPILQLIERLNSESYYERLEAQLAIEKLGRADVTGTVELLRNAKLSERGWLHGVWILARLQGTQATDGLFKLARNNVFPRVQPQVIRALADLHDPILVEHRLDAGLGDRFIAWRLAGLVYERDLSATLDVVVALGRLKWKQTPYWMSANLTQMWLSPDMAHATQQSLRRCGDWLAILQLLDDPPKVPNFGTPILIPPFGSNGKRRVYLLREVALHALADQIDKSIVDGLEVRIRLAEKPEHRREYADLLSRVYRKPSSQWVYWGFRPAPRPANTMSWERTELIEQTLIRLLADSDQDTRAFVLRRMQRENIPIPLSALADWLRDESNEQRLVAIFDALREHPADATRELLEAAIIDIGKLASSRRMAMRLWQASLGDAREARMIELARKLDDGDVLAALLNELGLLDSAGTANESVAELLLSKTQSKWSVVQAAAIEALARRHIADGAGAVVNLLQDHDVRVQRAAAFAAGQLEVRSAIPTLLQLGSADDTALRNECLDALRQLREPRVIPLAVAAAADATTELIALRCLAEFGGPEHAELVSRVARRGTSLDAVLVAVESLTRWSERDGLDAVAREELRRHVREVQGTSGALAAWRVIGPVSAEAAAKLVESLAAANAPESGKFAFGEGPNARVGQVENPPHETSIAISEFDVADAGAAQFLMSSNTPLRVWLNGKSVLERAEARRFQPESDRFDAALVKGTNRVVVQLSNVPDTGWEFHARLRRKSSKAEHERLVDAALTRPGNVERGRKLFLTVEKSQCLKCHRLNDQGEKIGPELTGIGSRFSRVHIIESLLEPSRTIAAGFQAQTVELADGRVLTGLKISETADTLVLADSQGKKHSLRKSDIEDSNAHAQSIMPDGLEKSLSLDEFVDLIAFLTGEKQSAGR